VAVVLLLLKLVLKADNSVGKQCERSYEANKGDTCDSVGKLHGMSGSRIKELNDFVGCNDIWDNTVLCLA